MNNLAKVHRLFQTLSVRRCSAPRALSNFVVKGVHEPEYLDLLKPQIPFYPLLNVQIKSYDYAVLESYGRYLHRLSDKLGLNVTKYWCAPYTSARFENLAPESHVVSTTNELHLYERNVQISDISGRLTSLLVEAVHRSLPAGVELSIHQHSHELHEKTRYITDFELLQHQADLKELVSNRSDDAEEEVKKK